MIIYLSYFPRILLPKCKIMLVVGFMFNGWCPRDLVNVVVVGYGGYGGYGGSLENGVN